MSFVATPFFPSKEIFFFANKLNTAGVAFCPLERLEISHVLIRPSRRCSFKRGAGLMNKLHLPKQSVLAGGRRSLSAKGPADKVPHKKATISDVLLSA